MKLKAFDEIYNLEALARLSRKYTITQTISQNPKGLNEIENRLDLINHLKFKYGKNISIYDI